MSSPVFCRDFRSKYLRQGPDRIGRKYRKAVFTQYSDETFTKRAEDAQRKLEQGIIGPVIRAQIRDQIKVIGIFYTIGIYPCYHCVLY